MLYYFPLILTPFIPTSLFGVNISTESLGQTFTVSLVELVAYLSGSYHKFVKTKDGELELVVPRDRSGEFEPQIVKKHQMDITKIEDKIIGLYGCGILERFFEKLSVRA